MTETSGRAVVIGAGLAGLAAGYQLSCNGWEVLALEKEDEVGGRCRTSEVGGFLFDAGVQHFRDSYDTTLKTAIEVGVGERLRMPTGGKGIVHGGRTVHFQPRSANPLSLLPWGSFGRRGIADFAALSTTLFRDYRSYDVRFPDRWKAHETETAEAFLSRKTTKEFREGFAEPVALYSGGADLDALSLSGFLVALRSTFADRPGCFTTGMGTLPRALAKRLNVETGMETVALTVEDGAATGVKARPRSGGRARTYGAVVVVCALPAPEAAGLLGELGDVARRVIESIEYSPSLVVNMGFDGGVTGDVGPVLLPAVEGFHSSWICTNESKAHEHAPGGGSVVTLVYSGKQASAAMGQGDDKILEGALADTVRVLDTKGESPVQQGVSRHPLGRTVMSPGHAASVGELAFSGSGVDNLFLAGDWTLSGTLEGAMRSGIEIARQIGLRR